MNSEGILGRRTFLGGLMAAPLAGMAPGREAKADEKSARGLIVRESEPRNLEMPFSELDSSFTPAGRFYVRSHFAVPELDASTWRLKIEGAVREPFEFGLQDLRRMPSRTIMAMLECAGNGRVFLVPKAKGLLWETGAVGNAEWTGVPLGALLERAGVKGGAVDVILEGADRGRIDDEPKSPGEIHFARSVPLAKAAGDVLLAYAMNGEDLTPAHGFPVRAVVPGWYGMASVKWLSRVIVSERPFAGYFQTLEYSTFERRSGEPTLVPLTENGVKAQVALPAAGEAVPRGAEYRVFGAAWAGEALVSRVDVSVDGGTSWTPARLLGEPIRHAWRLWDFTWKVPGRPGRHILMARATDDRGRTQPLKRDPDLRTVMVHHILPVEVTVR
ncbi:TMAO/DMSO reductase [Aquisphaera giovannonii]|uniref:TMAO/DMSO reductase n=1 Tax=Aquisphaera giovannonii TaxID=406548 RepID=A0A5B9WFN7_9BACT|nr:sulfite oxidase [Aquisphaera giovannonii]QEH38710.1 TMAO/DMSO reductase [Aquisphaera giovannonii]